MQPTKVAEDVFNGLKRYGSLYFAGEAIDGSVVAEVIGDVSDEVRTDVTTRFVIGPTTKKSFWSDERLSMNIDRGPCKLPASFTPNAS